MTRRLLCLHGHFYQPPRENPWIEAIEVQDSADPFHDWNERIAVECYGPNGAARVKNGQDRIVDIVNNYGHLSFNFGPTLLAWLERARPDAYARVLDADARSLAKRGHGNALAQGYNHAILPLLSARDRRTQIRWGVTDFRRRFRREPEGFWLPETAADTATLADLIEEGIRFTVLSPYQALRIRPPGGAWIDATGARFDPSRPYRVRLGGDKALVVFFYDGHIAQDIAFGGALGGSEALVAAIEGGYLAAREHDEVLTIAFDGETLGHHKKGGDEVLALAMRRLAGGSAGGIEVVNPGQVLDRIPVEWEAEIVEGSSWSCAHGLERWRSDCGCNTGGPGHWHQRWRAPLRGALDDLRGRLGAIYERQGRTVLADPWATRDRYVELVLDPERWESAEFLHREAGRALEPTEVVRALRLLEMERQALLMYTSCGWFFSELSGIETVQVLKYAARAIQLARDACGEDLEPGFVAALADAPSNVPALRDGREVYEQLVRPSVVSLEGVGAHLAIASAVMEMPTEGRVFCYRYRLHATRRARSGPAEVVLGHVELESLLTGETLDALACVLHFGAADFRCGLVPYAGATHHAGVEAALFGGIERLTLAQLLREVDRHFAGRDYTLRDLFLDERRRVADRILADTMRRYEDHYHEIFEDNLPLMLFLREIDSPVPGPLRVAADVALTRRLVDVTGSALAGRSPMDRAEGELAEAVALAQRLDAHLHLLPVRRDVAAMVRSRLEALLAGRAPATRGAELVRILQLATHLGLQLDLWDAQNRLWTWATSAVVSLDVETARELARALWFDEPTLLERAGYETVAAEAI
jgi:alpha-amylase/alpha-mannosidase (GH57 family)